MILLLIFSSCSSVEDQPQTSSPNTDYHSMASKFLNSKLEDGVTIDGKSVGSFENLKMDSVLNFSSQDLEYIKMDPLIKEYRTQIEYAQKLKAIDEAAGHGPDQTTIQAILKVQEIGKKVDEWESRAAQITDDDTLGYEVLFRVDLVFSDGTKSKSQRVVIRFDKAGSIISEWNHYI